MKESVIHHQPGPAESGKERQALCDIFQPRGVAVSSASSLLFPFGSPNTMDVGALCYVSMAMMHYKKWEKALLCEVSRVPEPGDVLKIDTGESCAVFPAPRAAVVPSQERVYLDHNATTAPHPAVREAMVRCLAGNFGNPSVLKACAWLEKRGVAVTYLPADEYGRVRLEDLEAVKIESVTTVRFVPCR